MRYCNHCHKITAGEPLFCNFCGRTYNAKLCPSRHINPRNAEICSQCGSRDLSLPQPRVPVRLTVLWWIVRALPGIVLWLMTVLLLIASVHALLYDPQVQLELMWIGLYLAAAWWLYMQLPAGIRRMLSGVFRLRNRNSHGDRSR